MTTIPLIWRSTKVAEAAIDEFLEPFLRKRTWHLSSNTQQKPPRTSLLTPEGTKHFLLHKVVLVLSQLSEGEKKSFWEFPLSSYQRVLGLRVQISFKDSNKFNCQLENLLVKDLGISFLETLPKEALVSKELDKTNETLNTFLENIKTNFSGEKPSEGVSAELSLTNEPLNEPLNPQTLKQTLSKLLTKDVEKLKENVKETLNYEKLLGED